MAKFDIQAFFNNIDGKTWSLGSAFKRADALPLDLYSVWKTKAEAETYASTHATAYPGQILIVVEKENEVDVIKLYYIDENRTLQEVGSATLGDEKTIVLDPDSKILSIKGFEEAGWEKTIDTIVPLNKTLDKPTKTYYTLDEETGDYVEVPVENLQIIVNPDPKEDEPKYTSVNPSVIGYYERIPVKLIKDSAGNLSWTTDDAVKIQGNIAALQTTVNDHGIRIGTLETNVKDLGDNLEKEIASLGTVFNFVGSLTINEFAATTGADSIIDTDKKIPNGDRAYRAGDVIFVTVPVSDEPDAAIKYTQEYVATATTGGLIWEAFGDPTGVTGIESRVTTLEGTATSHANSIGVKTHQKVDSEGKPVTDAEGKPVMEASTGLYLYAEEQAIEKANAAVTAANGYTDTKVKDVKDIADANALEIHGRTAQGTPGEEGYLPAVTGLKTKVETNSTNIANINTEINGDATSTDNKIKAGIKGRITTLENESAKASDLSGLSTTVEALGNNLNNNYITSSDIAKTYETIKNVDSVRTTVADNTRAIQANTNAIGVINVQLNGADGEGGLVKTVEGLTTVTQGHGTKIAAIEGSLKTINGTGVGSIAEALSAAGVAQTAANNAQTDATQALKDAKAASDLAGTKATLDDVKALNYATKTEAEGYAKAVQGNTTETVASAYAKAEGANTAADSAQDRADEAYDLADSVKTDLANNYTKTTDMNAAIAAVISDGSDDINDITVQGARLYAKDLADGLKSSIDDINAALVDLTTVMNFVGVFDTLPATKDAEGKDLYQVGDVCIVDEQEYVLVEVENVKDWEPFGTVTADAARFEAIEKVIGTRNTDGTLIPGAVGTLLKDVDDLQDLTTTLKSTSDGYATRFTDAEGRIKVIEDTINDTTDAEGGTVKGLATRLTDVEKVAAAAATQEALNKEISDRGVAEKALDDKITDGFAGQNTVNTELQANIDAIYKLNEDGTDSGLLTWGTFE